MSKEDLARAQLQVLSDQLMLQFGSVLFSTMAYLIAVLILLFVLLNLRRCALAAFFVFGALTFVVPTPVTALFSPVIMLTSVVGITWLTIAARSRNAAAAVNVAAAPPPRAKPVAS